VNTALQAEKRCNFDCEEMRDEESLPKHWPNPKKKIFHLVRQLYGQMVSGKRRYDIMHTYERWFFCMRTEAGTLEISRPFKSTNSQPSVFQTMKTMTAFENHELVNAPVHPSSTGKAARTQRKRSSNRDDSQPKKTPKLPPSYNGGPIIGDGFGRGDGTGESSGPENLASTLFVCDCEFLIPRVRFS
jgi:hypothetical protein